MPERALVSPSAALRVNRACAKAAVPTRTHRQGPGALVVMTCYPIPSHVTSDILGTLLATDPVIVVHGGAWAMPDDMVDAHIHGVRNAMAAGWRVLERGGSALDAVEEAVVIMEDDETFDAGRGSFLNRDGKVQLDALSWMEPHCVPEAWAAWSACAIPFARRARS